MVGEFTRFALLLDLVVVVHPGRRLLLLLLVWFLLLCAPPGTQRASRQTVRRPAAAPLAGPQIPAQFGDINGTKVKVDRERGERGVLGRCSR